MSTGMAFFTEQRYFCSFVSNSTTRGSLSEGFLVDRHGLFYTTGFILSLGNVFCEQAYNKGSSLWVFVDRHGLSYMHIFCRHAWGFVNMTTDFAGRHGVS